jgi:hypothetical protein
MPLIYVRPVGIGCNTCMQRAHECLPLTVDVCSLLMFAIAQERLQTSSATGPGAAALLWILLAAAGWALTSSLCCLPGPQLKPVLGANYSRKLAALKHRQVTGGRLLRSCCAQGVPAACWSAALLLLSTMGPSPC